MNDLIKKWIRVGPAINVWLKLDDFVHECCDCGLQHNVKMKVKDGKIHIKFTPRKKPIAFHGVSH